MASSLLSPSSTMTAIASATSAAPSATSSAAGDSTNDSSGPRSLLFFVALGFGVVFTNLWVIVGVKYCFRYNRRQRALQQGDDNGDPIDMTNINRPRRRREKKLMSMDEVNQRFPLTKYKIWCATREQEGLPSAGGVTAPPSRAPSVKGSVRDSIGVAAEPDAPRASTVSEAAASDPPITTSTTDLAGTSTRRSMEARASVDAKKTMAPLTTIASVDSVVDEKQLPTAMHAEHAGKDDDVDDDDPIRDAAPAEIQPGDSCAICIDNLEDDDEVRGLTCGHAFHAGCIDPWLTGRRACCPLCKADYYILQPRPGRDAVSQVPETTLAAASESRPSQTSSRPAGWLRLPPLSYQGRSRQPASSSAAAATNEAARTNHDTRSARALNWFRNIPDHMPSMRIPTGRSRAAGRNGARAEDLEAGRPSVPQSAVLS